MGLWLIFVAAWLSILLILVFRWKGISVDIRYDLVGILVFFGVLWVRQLPAQNNEFDRFTISMALAVVSSVVHRLV